MHDGRLCNGALWIDDERFAHAVPNESQRINIDAESGVI